MKREDLKALELSDEAIDAVMKMHGEGINALKSEITTAKTEAETLKSQLAEAGKQIEEFKGLDIEGVRKAADEWKAKAEQAAQDAEKQVKAMQFDHALEKALVEAKVKDPADIRPHLKVENIQYADGKFIGLDEQLKPLKESKAYLFLEDKPAPRIVAGGQAQTMTGDKMVDAARAAAGLKPEGK
jgi:hypothetical protein